MTSLVEFIVHDKNKWIFPFFFFGQSEAGQQSAALGRAS